MYQMTHPNVYPQEIIYRINFVVMHLNNLFRPGFFLPTVRSAFSATEKRVYKIKF